MAAQALPETIEPGSLYIPDGKAGYSIAAASVPNGDDGFLLTEAAGVENFQAYQDEDPDHLLGTGACALSFWIRRRQNFDASGGQVPGLRNDTYPTTARFIMGVMDPLAVAVPTVANKALAWAVQAYTTQQIQFTMLGLWVAAGQPYWLSSDGFTLVTNQWHFVVVNRDPAPLNGSLGAAGNNGEFQVYLDGNSVGSAAQSAVWTLYPNPTNPQRFGIGDLTTGGRTIGGASAGAAVDLAKIAFHSRKLTSTDMLELIDSMRYGGPT